VNGTDCAQHPLSQVYSFVPIPGAQQHKRPRRRYEEIERMYKCGWNGCEKAYGTLNHLNAHVTMQSHGQKRTPEGMFDFVITLFTFYTVFSRYLHRLGCNSGCHEQPYYFPLSELNLMLASCGGVRAVYFSLVGRVPCVGAELWHASVRSCASIGYPNDWDLADHVTFLT
jgi:hypothetical protein